jgi:hypothetical protein
MTRVLIIASLLAFSGVALSQQYGPPFDTGRQYDNATGTLRTPIPKDILASNTIENIYCSYGKLTTLMFNTKETIYPPVIGSPVVQVVLDSERRTVDIVPTIQKGETNMNIQIGKVMYSFYIHIGDENKTHFRKTYTTEDFTTANLPSNAKPMKPSEIDVVGLQNTFSRMVSDPTFAQRTSGIQHIALNRTYSWNNCVIHLSEGWKDVANDIIVLKVTYQNASDNALYLHAKQIQPYLGNKSIPVTAYTQIGPLLYPTQVEEMFLYIQGYRLALDNAWEIKLPPGSEAIRKTLGVR